MIRIENLILDCKENIICSIGKICKIENNTNQYETEVDILDNSITEIGEKSFKSIRLNCNDLPFFIVGNVWNRNKSVRQNLSLGRQGRSIQIPSTPELEPKSLYMMLGVSQNKLLQPYTKTEKEDNDFKNTKGIKEAHELLLLQSVLISISTMYAYFLKLQIDGINYLFPCSEVARKFYFKSDVITKHIIENTFINIAGKISIENVNNERLGTFWAIEGFDEEERNELAALVLDDERYRAHQIISEHIQKAFIKKNESSAIKAGRTLPLRTFYKTKFPTSQPFEMDVCGKQFRYNDSEYFLVFQIFSENSDQYLPYDSYQIIIQEGDHRSITAENENETKNYENTRFNDKPSKERETSFNSTVAGNTRSIRRKFELIIETTNTFEIQKPSGKILPKKEQLNSYSGSTKIITRDTNIYGSIDASSMDNNFGSATVTSSEHLPKKIKEEFLVMIRALNALQSKEIIICHYEFENEIRVKEYDFDSIKNKIEMKYILVSIEYEGYVFYLLSFNDNEKDTRDVIIYNKIQRQIIKNADLEMIVEYISCLDKVPSEERFNDRLIKMNINLLDCTISRMNHTQSDHEKQKLKIKQKLDSIIKKMAQNN